MKKDTLLTQGDLTKQIIRFMIPIILSTFFQHFYIMADAAIVGQYLGDVELAAVGGSATKIIAMTINFFVGVGAGVSSYVARYYGAKDLPAVKKSIFNGVILFTSLSVVISVLAGIFNKNILVAMNTPADTLHSATVYLNTYLYGLAFCVLYNISSSVLRAIGDSKSPFYVLIFTSFVNIFLDILFVVVFNMGVFGAAFATVLAQGLSALVLFFILYKKLPQTEDKPQICFETMRKISVLGLPAGGQALMFGVTNILMQTAINSLGVINVAAWVAYIKIDTLTEIFASASGVAALTFVGQNFGAGNMQRVHQSVTKLLQIGFGVTVTITVMLMATRMPLLSLFTDSEEIKILSASLMFIIMPMYALSIPYNVLSQALRGLGDTFVPMIIAAVGIVGVRLVWIFGIFPLNKQIQTLGLCYPVGAIILSTAFIVYYRHKIKAITASLERTTS